jgi:hypothetical protein
MSVLSDKRRRSAGRRRPAADPVFEAIENHRRAYLRFDRATGATDDFEARREGRFVTDADELEYDLACAAEDEALAHLKATLPTSVAGARALLQYIRYRGVNRGFTESASAILLTNLLHSPPLSGA